MVPQKRQFSCLKQTLFDPFGGKSLVFLHFCFAKKLVSYWIAIDPRNGTKVSGTAKRLFRLPRQRFLFVKGLFSKNLQTCAGIPPVVGSLYDPLSQKKAAGFGGICPNDNSSHQ